MLRFDHEIDKPSFPLGQRVGRCSLFCPGGYENPAPDVGRGARAYFETDRGSGRKLAEVHLPARREFSVGGRRELPSGPCELSVQRRGNSDEPGGSQFLLESAGHQAGASAAQWTAAFLAKYPYRRNGEEALRQCSLSVHDASQFEAAIQVSATNLKASDDPWNELIVKPWQAADIPEIEAFFWSANSEGLFYDDDFLKAKEMAKKYVSPDGKPVPVVKVNLHANVVSLP